MEHRLAQFIRDRAKETYPEPITEGHSAITAQMAERVAKHLPEGALVIDIGCGQGPALEWFKEHGFNGAGFTINREDITRCREKGLFAYYGDMHAIPSEDADAGCVWARHVLEHSIAPFFALHEFNRVLKMNGILYVEVPAPDTSCQHHLNANHYSVLTKSMWGSLITRSGFEILELIEMNLTTGVGPDTYYGFTCRKTK